MRKPARSRRRDGDDIDVSDRCVACETELRASARFCDACGAPLVSGERQAEFKQVTVLFADVVRSMDIAVAVGPERLREIMTGLLQLASRVVQRCGGTVDKFTGDGVMAVFGAPRALEDHALRACIAALNIQQEVSRLAVETRERDGLTLRVRIGLNSGQVIAGDMGTGPSSYTTIGEQVGMAQRMESVAPPGGVMLSESTARLVDRSTMLSDPEAVTIKGAETPVLARRLLALNDKARVPNRRLSTLVGRDREMSTIGGMLDQSINGKGRIAALVGPPGIGKSRMTQEVALLAADRGVEVFTTFCESHTSELPFHAVTGLLRDIFALRGLDGDAARATVRSRLQDADREDLAILEDVLGIAGSESASPEVDPDARGRRLASMFNAAGATRSTPTVYVVEDAHWIDEASESLFAQFVAVVPHTRSLLLVTYRPEYHGALDRLSSSQRIALATLDDSESSALVSELLGDDPSVAELARSVSGRAAGNPFFTEEIVRDLAERGVVDGSPGNYVCRQDRADPVVPASLQATIAARIDRLGSAAKLTLNAAAVIGMQFSVELLGELASDVELTELLTAELVDQVAFTGVVEYAFRHPLIRTVAYESQLKTVRAELHQRLAAAIEHRDPESADANAALIAQHLELAGDYRKAYDWHMRAGAWAQYRDIGAARTSWHRAREVADGLPGDGGDAVAQRIAPRALICTSTWRISGSVEDAGFDELRDLALSIGDGLSLAMATAGVLTIKLFHYQFAGAASIASTADDLSRTVGDHGLTVTLWTAASNAKFQAGEVREGLRMAQRAIDLVEGEPTRDNIVLGSPLAVALALRGANRLSLGIPGWREDLDRAIDIARPVDTTSLCAAALYKYGFTFHNGTLQTNRARLAEAAELLERAERFGDDFSLDSARLALGSLLVKGEVLQRQEGLRLLDQYRCATIAHGFTTSTVRFADTDIAGEMARRGDLDGAVDLARKTVDSLFACGDMATRGPAMTVLVEALLQRGTEADIAEGAAAIERLAVVPVDPGFVLHELPLLRLRALLARANGDEAGYRTFADRYRKMAKDLGFEGHVAKAEAMS